MDLLEQLRTTLGGHVVIDRELGGGGMSRVFVAKDTQLGRWIAVKVLPPEMGAAVSIVRFEREIALMARLQHPHVVPLLHAGDADGIPYYTMPFIEGESLRQRLSRSGEFPVGDAVRLLRQMATALEYAHQQGVIHRDLKPENVLLTGGIAMVTDFGVAKALSVATTLNSTALTSEGFALGTPAYMAPEQATADPSIDQRADLYALGLIGYEMLCGFPPFLGRSAMALVSAHLTESPEPLTNRRQGVPAPLAELLMRCLEKRPADRPQTAAEIIAVLDSLTAVAQTTPSASVAAPRRFSRRSAMLALAVLVVVAAGAWVTLGRRPAKATSTRLLVAPFENLTGDARFNGTGRIAADRLALRLAQVGSIDVVPSITVLLASRDSTRDPRDWLNALAAATHAGQIVTGTIVLRGDSLVLQAQITDVQTGKAVATIEPDAGLAADPIAVIDSLGERLLGALGIRDINILSPSGFRAPTNAAYQQFALGFTQFAINGDGAASRPFFVRAIALDSSFVRAYQLLGRQYLNAGEFDRADSLVKRMERIPQGLTAGERLFAEFMKAELRGDLPGMMRVQQQLVARDSSALSLYLVGESAVYQLKPDIAIPALESSRAPYLVFGGAAASLHTSDLSAAYHLAGDYASEQRLLDEYGDLIRPTALRRTRWMALLAATKQTRAALALADTLLAGGDVRAAEATAVVLRGAEEFRAQGDTANATRMFSRVVQWFAVHHEYQLVQSAAMIDGIALLATGSLDRAAARFELAARDTLHIDAAGWLGIAEAARGDRARALAIADSIGNLRRPWLFGEHTYWKAAILGALGERESAVELLRGAFGEGRKMQRWPTTSELASLHGFAPFEALIAVRRK